MFNLDVSPLIPEYKQHNAPPNPHSLFNNSFQSISPQEDVEPEKKSLSTKQPPLKRNIVTDDQQNISLPDFGDIDHYDGFMTSFDTFELDVAKGQRMLQQAKDAAQRASQWLNQSKGIQASGLGSEQTYDTKFIFPVIPPLTKNPQE